MINSKTALFGVVIAVVAGVFGANVVQIHDDSQKPLTNSLVAGYSILGHITLVEKDSHGHIVAYRQTDNQIVNPGLNCMALALFRSESFAADSVSDSDNCGGSLAASATGTQYFNIASGFRFIQIGAGTTGTSAATGVTQNALQTPVTNAGATADTIGTVSFTPAGTGNSATFPVVSVSATGLTVSGTANTIAEAGLFDNWYTGSGTTWPNMFARQTFATITMGSGDTLAVTWTITLQP